KLSDPAHATRGLQLQRRLRCSAWLLCNCYSWKRDDTVCPTASSLFFQQHLIRHRSFSTASTCVCANMRWPCCRAVKIIPSRRPSALPLSSHASCLPISSVILPRTGRSKKNLVHCSGTAGFPVTGLSASL